MTYEEIMSIAPGSIVPGGYSINPNATYMGPGEPILDSNGSVLAGGHSVSTNDMIVVLDVGYTKQLALIQYPIGNGEYRQGYIVNNPNNIQYPNIGTNNWVNGSTTETVYLSYEGNQVLGSLDPHESAIFLYKVNDRYNIVYSTDKGFYTKAGFVNYSGGITAQALEGQVLSGGGGSSIDNLPAGSIVPGGRTYPVNATAQVDLDLRDAQGNSIPGREVSAGDELTVLDVGYTRQLALVQYPSGESIRQGYITNNDKYIKYKNPNNWYNGSTPEPVLDASGAQIGTINPYESATKLYEANGLTEVVYNTDKGINTKSGFVKYAGATPNIAHVDIPYPNVTSAELINYGTSGKGRALRAYKIGNGRNSFIYNCAIHGWEDNWPADGVELTKIGNQIIEHFQNNSTGDFTLYVIPAANPDGVSEGWTNNGPGRCTIVGGIDCNRDFPVGFTPGGRARNYTGSEPLNVPESKCLADFIQGIKSKTAGKTYLIDMHGWEQSAIGSSIIGEHFVGKLGLEPKYRYANAGYLIDWANSIGIISALIELPTSTYSHADVVNRNYAGKIIEALTEIMGTSSSSTGGNYNGKINSGVSSVNVRQEPNTSSTILGQLHGNDGIEILAKVKPYGDSYYWYEIVFIKDGQGVQAYVREDFVTVTGEIPKSDIPAAGGEPSKTDVAYQTVGQVNNVAASVHVRKGAGTGIGCDVVTSVNSGELLMILGQVQPGGETIPWYEIDINGQELYIRSDFVDIVPEEKMDKQGKVSSSEGWANLRELPGTRSEYSIISRLDNGVSVEIVGKLQPKGESLPWYRIRWQEEIGFIRLDLIVIDTVPDITESPDKLFESMILNVNGYDIEFEWMEIKGAYHLFPKGIDNLEKYHHAFAPSLAPQEILSLVVNISPLGEAKNIIDFITGRDIITGEKVDRVKEFVCIFLPDIANVLLKTGFKNSGEVLNILRETGPMIRNGNYIVGEARKYWTKCEIFKGIKVYQRDDLIDPLLKNKRGLTNLQLMEKGNAPIDKISGKPINLHHMTQQNDSAIVEVTKDFHQINTKVIHINPNKMGSGINRSAFDSWRRAYWKNRAKDFK